MSTNKQQLKLNNTDLQSILSTVIGLPTQEAVKNGKYVWGKYDGYTPAKSGNASISAVTRPVSNTIMTLNLTGGITYDEFSTDLLTGWTFVNAYTLSGRTYTYKFLDGKTIRYTTKYTSTTTQDVAYSYDPTTHQISFSDPTSSDKVALKAFNAGSFTTKSITKSEGYGEHLGFVVDDDNSAYPDGGTQDGYWYEKINDVLEALNNMGFTKAEYGTVTPSSANYALTIPHSLGVEPKLCFVRKTTYSINNVVLAFSASLLPKLAFGGTATSNTDMIPFFNDYNNCPPSFGSSNVVIDFTYKNYKFEATQYSYLLLA